MFTRFGSLTGSLTLKINIKKPVASLLVCCLLFGSLTLGAGTLSLTLGSVTLSSCSSKKNPANRGVINSNAHATSDPVAKKTVADKEEAEKKEESTKDLAWLKSPFVTTFAAMVVSDLVTNYVFSMPKVREKTGQYREAAEVGMYFSSPLVVITWNTYYTYSNYGSWWSGLWQSIAGTFAGVAAMIVKDIYVRNAN